MRPLVKRLAALTNGHDDVRLETAGRIAGRWFAAMDSDAGHDLIAAGFLILPGRSTATAWPVASAAA